MAQLSVRDLDMQGKTMKKYIKILYFSSSFSSFKCILNRKWFAKIPTNIPSSSDDNCDSFSCAIRISLIIAVLANT